MELDLGYAAEGAGPLANHVNRKELSETVVLCICEGNWPGFPGGKIELEHQS